MEKWKLVLGVLLFVFYYLLLRFSQHCVYYVRKYECVPLCQRED